MAVKKSKKPLSKKKNKKESYRYYPCCAYGTITKVALKDIKPGNAIWHIGDTYASFKEAVLVLEHNITQDIAEKIQQLNEAESWIRTDKRILKSIELMKKSKEYK